MWCVMGVCLLELLKGWIRVGGAEAGQDSIESSQGAKQVKVGHPVWGGTIGRNHSKRAIHLIVWMWCQMRVCVLVCVLVCSRARELTSAASGSSHEMVTVWLKNQHARASPSMSWSHMVMMWTGTSPGCCKWCTINWQH